MALFNNPFRAWEAMIRDQSLRTNKHPDGGSELRRNPSASEQLARHKLQECWAQQYVREEFRRLGFSKIDGPFSRGPDFRVLYKRRWVWVEVETRWQNYLTHAHNSNPVFTNVHFLILLSEEDPPVHALSTLPPEVIHINQKHFLAWYENASLPQARGQEFATRVAVVAPAMQEHWISLCSDVGRAMSICPDCDGCPYFGTGSFGESTPFFQDLAARFIIANGALSQDGFDLGDIKPVALQRFVEGNPLND